jgi:hypothetical protein
MWLQIATLDTVETTSEQLSNRTHGYILCAVRWQILLIKRNGWEHIIAINICMHLALLNVSDRQNESQCSM